MGSALCLILASSVFVAAGNILIEDFSDPNREWTPQNDPVMGGQSESTVQINDGMLDFQGQVNIVPSLGAPGFIKAQTGTEFSGPMGGNFPGAKLFGMSSNGGSGSWPDVSGCEGLTITGKSGNDYDGYYVSFGTERPPEGRFFARGYKAILEPSNEMTSMSIPFNQFSNLWDDATGEILTSCEENNRYCPNQATLQNMETMAFWGEGVEGAVDLQISKIEAYGCGDSDDSN